MRRTEFFVLAVAAISLGAVDRAFSGDLNLRTAPPPIYAPPPPISWTGCYGGLNAGGVWSPGINDVGVTGGGQVGCNWQWSPLLLGGEADIQYTGLDGSRDVFASDASAHENFRSRWLATFRGRLGYLVVPNMNFYATGGLAVANVDRTSVVTLNGNTSNVSDSTTHAGWTLGAGLEWMFRPGWSAKVEYLYVDLGDVSCAACLPAASNADFRAHVVRAGLNFRF